jgi:hypothetical protein
VKTKLLAFATKLAIYLLWLEALFLVVYGVARLAAEVLP